MVGVVARAGGFCRYAYSVLALAMSAKVRSMLKVAALYRQLNSRIRKDAHYTLSYLLGEEVARLRPTESVFGWAVRVALSI